MTRREGLPEGLRVGGGVLEEQQQQQKTRGDVRGRSQLEWRSQGLSSPPHTEALSRSPLSRRRPQRGRTGVPNHPRHRHHHHPVCLFATDAAARYTTRAASSDVQLLRPVSPPTFRPGPRRTAAARQRNRAEIRSDVERQAPQSAAPAARGEGGWRRAFDAASIATSITSHSLEEAA